jgi:hypothetical protein
VSLLVARPDLVEGIAEGTLAVTASFADDEPLPYADAVDIVLVSRGATATLLPRDATACAPVASLDPGRPLFAVTADPGAGVTLECAPADLAVARERASLATAAVLVGLSEAAIAKTVEYTASRTQFGRPIGSFQALQHAVAEVEMQTRLARGLVRYAAAAQASGGLAAPPGPPADALAAMARVSASRAAQATAETALQAHGAIGYSQEYDLGRVLTRIWALLPAWGELAWQRRRALAAFQMSTRVVYDTRQ